MKGNVNACETVVAMLVNDVAVLVIVHPALRCIIFLSFFLFTAMVLDVYQALKKDVSFYRLVIGSSDVGTINAFHHATGTINPKSVYTISYMLAQHTLPKCQFFQMDSS